jgi:ABC-type amino acid transport substrate-binding protein
VTRLRYQRGFNLFLWLLISSISLLPLKVAANSLPVHAAVGFETALFNTPSIQLTPQERQWLNDHQPLRIAFDGYFPPYSYLDENGQLIGYAVDMWRLLARKLNIQYKIDHRYIWKDLYEAAKKGEIDLVATMVDRPERRAHFKFTQPYVFKDISIFARIDNNEIHSIKDLPHHKVAMVQHYQYVPRILQAYPTIQPYYADTLDEALQAVAKGKADAVLGHTSAVNFLIALSRLPNLKYVDTFDRFHSNESFAVPLKNAPLADILDKALSQVSKTELTALQAKWAPLIHVPVDRTELIKQGVFLGGIILLLLLLLYRIYQKNQALKTMEAALQESNAKLEKLNHELEDKVKERTQALELAKAQYQSLVENLHQDYFFYRRGANDKVTLTYVSPSVSDLLDTDIEAFLKEALIKSLESLREL